MKNTNHSTLLTKNHIGKISDDERFQQQDYLEAIKAFARLTYESVYVINYETMTFEYVSENPLFLCGHSPADVMKLGYEFYFKNVPDNDLTLLNTINEAGFDFFQNLPGEEKIRYSITYDFHLLHRDGKKTLINHKLTPLLLTKEKKMWKAMCIVSISHHKNPGNVFIHKQGSGELWELDLKDKAWRKSTKPKLTRREIEVLQLHAQGLSINEIAAQLSVAPDTVKYYRRQIFDRLNVSTIAGALSYAVNSKLI
ncbi:helix-turn-helix transcriptional regulator [Dawidia soli]|uniref:Helix-turn-helix transcriptional regulator n=1 Tax=Dawidia soli TaxID=2782352 RepID=A0AAP2D7P5_9BACT|nr:helix-turn-helix transcriptional regulator [Dawidia soli]MBT1686799.1 helix-turn-helix transcriptional regulator [Dawidia soli]